jgi:hypothetical protein
MITVSNRAGLHSLACGVDDFWGHDVDKQWRKTPIFVFPAECCSNATLRSGTIVRWNDRLDFTSLREMSDAPMKSAARAQARG